MFDRVRGSHARCLGAGHLPFPLQFRRAYEECNCKETQKYNTKPFAFIAKPSLSVFLFTFRLLHRQPSLSLTISGSLPVYSVFCPTSSEPNPTATDGFCHLVISPARIRQAGQQRSECCPWRGGSGIQNQPHTCPGRQAVQMLLKKESQRSGGGSEKHEGELQRRLAFSPSSPLFPHMEPPLFP